MVGEKHGTSSRHSENGDEATNSDESAATGRRNSEDPGPGNVPLRNSESEAAAAVTNSGDPNENKILKSEIVSLNREVKSLLGRIKTSEEGWL